MLSWTIIGIATGVGITTATVGVPVAVSVLGFKAGGIVAGSIAAKMMSAAAIANGGAVVGGSAVSVLQSVGVLGLSVQSTALIGGATTLIGSATGGAYALASALWN